MQIICKSTLYSTLKIMEVWYLYNNFKQLLVQKYIYKFSDFDEEKKKLKKANCCYFHSKLKT